jgi:hypothetical protein
MAKEHAVRGAQEEITRAGLKGTVIDVRREGRSAVLVLQDGRTMSLSGLSAVKVLKMLDSRFDRWRAYTQPRFYEPKGHKR